MSQTKENPFRLGIIVWCTLAHFNLFVARIATASFMAYALGQILDVHVFNRLRQSRHWWLAPT
ncbi:VUT family protein, partial [Pseudomonas aeruginosa]|uniref:VUT family protein n=1 Tax=Pseudomonas aeruginosa TaxID=287 RepID=UPI003F815770